MNSITPPEAQSANAPQDSRPLLRERRLFESLLDGKKEHVLPGKIERAFAAAGLSPRDPRLADCRRALAQCDPAEPLDFETFCEVIRPNIVLIERALQGSLIIQDFEKFTGEIEAIFEDKRGDRRGKVADYIPQLGRVDPEKFALSIHTIDGQQFSLGDADEAFCVQSCCKPINYCLALEEHGPQKVHSHVGCEPSGRSFNELSLNMNGRPHNPMINAGAIMSCSLIQPDRPLADRFDHVMDRWRAFAGGIKPGFSNPTYLSERQTADRNFALGYFLREHRAFPEKTDLVETLEFYFQCCSLEMTATSLARVAATLAGGGICPTTGEVVVQPETVQSCLSLMYSCGMYDFSGEWAFTVGLPAKSGVSGAILVVVPNVLGLCVWSPRLDDHGNSIRGIEVCRELVGRYNFHNYDNLLGGRHHKRNPRSSADHREDATVALCWAASKGDLTEIRRLVARGVDLDASDYDGRTALHLAASEGHTETVAFLLDRGVVTNPRDRWGGTPLDDARREGRSEIVALLDSGSKENQTAPESAER